MKQRRIGKIAILCGLGILLMLLLKYRGGKTKIVIIRPGMTTAQIACLLDREGLIIDENYFLFLGRLKRATNRIKAGTYELNSRWSTGKILNKLIAGDTLTIKLTIPEGYRAEQVAELSEEKGLGNKERFLQLVQEKNLEGLLFPDTYFVDPDMDEEEIIELMVNQFNRVFTEQMKEEARKYKLTVRDVVILASIIEKEAKVAEEKPLISGVFYNRLRKRIPLEADPTVRYALKKFSGRLSYKDLELDSPYNTYIHYGLPCGPICNPGRSALLAAVYPARTDFLYFVARGDGTHIFSKTYKEHLAVQNIKK